MWMWIWWRWKMIDRSPKNVMLTVHRVSCLVIYVCVCVVRSKRRGSQCHWENFGDSSLTAQEEEAGKWSMRQRKVYLSWKKRSIWLQLVGWKFQVFFFFSCFAFALLCFPIANTLCLSILSVCCLPLSLSYMIWNGRPVSPRYSNLTSKLGRRNWSW